MKRNRPADPPFDDPLSVLVTIFLAALGICAGLLFWWFASYLSVRGGAL